MVAPIGTTTTLQQRWKFTPTTLEKIWCFAPSNIVTRLYGIGNFDEDRHGLGKIALVTVTIYTKLLICF